MRLSLHWRGTRSKFVISRTFRATAFSGCAFSLIIVTFFHEVSISRAVADPSRALPPGRATQRAVLTCTRGSTASSIWSGSSALSFCTHPLIIRSRGGILFTALHATCVCIVCYISGGHVGYRTYDHGAGQDRHMPRREGAREHREVSRESPLARTANVIRGRAIIGARIGHRNCATRVASMNLFRRREMELKNFSRQYRDVGSNIAYICECA